MNAALIELALFVAIAVVFYGLRVGWFDRYAFMRVRRVLSRVEVELSDGSILNTSYPHYLREGDRLALDA